jgi:ATP-dependent DNA helicase RecG
VLTPEPPSISAPAAVADSGIVMTRAGKAHDKVPAAKAGRGLADQLARLGLAREADVVLHLPLSYEDHTRIVPLASLQPGLAQQAEGVID